MKSRARLALLAGVLPFSAAVAQVAGDPPGGEGPRASSGDNAARYDAVGQAAVEPALGTGVLAAHPILAEGSFAEVTSLDSGRTIVARVVRGGTPDAGVLAGLSPAAARQLGIASSRAPVRIRPATPSPQDQASLAAGRAADARLDTPPMLLAALRRRLGEGAAASPPASLPRSADAAAARATPTPRPFAPTRAAPSAVAAPVPKPFVPDRPAVSTRPAAAPKIASPAKPALPVTGGFVIQVATLSDADRARSLARGLNGQVVAIGRLYRVRTGPYATRAAAERARADLARRGHPDAQILRQD